LLLTARLLSVIIRIIHKSLNVVASSYVKCHFVKEWLLWRIYTITTRSVKICILTFQIYYWIFLPHTLISFLFVHCVHWDYCLTLYIQFSDGLNLWDFLQSFLAFNLIINFNVLAHDLLNYTFSIRSVSKFLILIAMFRFFKR
jgi:hypothetical protein